MLTIEHTGLLGTRPDPNVWRAQVGPVANELQVYTAAGNAWNDGDGHLVLEARREPDGRYTSARLDTKGILGKGIQPGSFVQFDALLPYHDGAFPAGWLTGTNQPLVGYAAAGELDIVEIGGAWVDAALLNAHAAYYDAQLERMATAQGLTLEEAKSRKWHYQTGWGEKAQVPLDLSAWHTYAVDFDGNGVRWWIDGKVRKTTTKADFDKLGVQWPFNKPLDLIFNLAVGSAGGTPVPDENGAWSAQMKIGPIRIGRFADFATAA